MEAKRQSTAPLCPHCEHPLRPFRLPDNSGWDDNVHLACFEDDCPYFRRGWTWMFDHYGVKASYRYRIDPVSGTESPLPVWSRDAIKNCILDADVVAEPAAGDDVSGGSAADAGPVTGDRAADRPKRRTAPAASPRKGKTS